MGLKLKNFGGSLNAEQNISNSEIDKSSLDIEASDFKGDANIKQTLRSVKAYSTIVWIVVSLASITAFICHFI